MKGFYCEKLKSPGVNGSTDLKKSKRRRSNSAYQVFINFKMELDAWFIFPDCFYERLDIKKNW